MILDSSTQAYQELFSWLRLAAHAARYLGSRGSSSLVEKVMSGGFMSYVGHPGQYGDRLAVHSSGVCQWRRRNDHMPSTFTLGRKIPVQNNEAGKSLKVCLEHHLSLKMSSTYIFRLLSTSHPNSISLTHRSAATVKLFQQSSNRCQSCNIYSRGQTEEVQTLYCCTVHP